MSIGEKTPPPKARKLAPKKAAPPAPPPSNQPATAEATPKSAGIPAIVWGLIAIAVLGIGLVAVGSVVAVGYYAYSKTTHKGTDTPLAANADKTDEMAEVKSDKMALQYTARKIHGNGNKPLSQGGGCYKLDVFVKADLAQGQKLALILLRSKDKHEEVLMFIERYKMTSDGRTEHNDATIAFHDLKLGPHYIVLKHCETGKTECKKRIDETVQ